MSNILESRLEFKNNQLHRITVLVEVSKGDVRAMSADTTPKGGYMSLKPNQPLSNELIKKVAGYGLEIDKDEIFPDWRTKTNNG